MCGVFVQTDRRTLERKPSKGAFAARIGEDLRFQLLIGTR